MTFQIKIDYNIDWQAESMKYLGMYLPKDLDRFRPINYDPLNSKMKVDIAGWNLLSWA